MRAFLSSPCFWFLFWFLYRGRNSIQFVVYRYVPLCRWRWKYKYLWRIWSTGLRCKGWLRKVCHDCFADQCHQTKVHFPEPQTRQTQKGILYCFFTHQFFVSVRLISQCRHFSFHLSFFRNSDLFNFICQSLSDSSLCPSWCHSQIYQSISYSLQTEFCGPTVLQCNIQLVPLYNWWCACT